jgi:hypothetical protein
MNSYEKDFCKVLDWDCRDNRYYDCVAHNTYIELKKGKGMMWFDLVRYSEIYLGKGVDNTITLFVQYDKPKKCVNEIYLIPTERIVEFLELTREKAEFCIALFKGMPRGLNMQASMTKTDMRKIATSVIKI